MSIPAVRPWPPSAPRQRGAGSRQSDGEGQGARCGLIRAAANAVLSVIIAPACAACGRLLDRPAHGPVCSACWQGVARFTPPLCLTCGDPLPSWRALSLESGRCPRCRRSPVRISRAAAIGPYDGALRDIVHALKYGRHRSVAGPLGHLMNEAGRDVLAGADCVVPVPLHWRRRRARGFNQAEDLARHLDLPCRRVLRRTRTTPSQTDLPAARRHANVRGAFAIRRASSVQGLSIVLVDDVSTTGATLSACADALLAAGAREVRAITAARVVSTRPR